MTAPAPGPAGAGTDAVIRRALTLTFGALATVLVVWVVAVRVEPVWRVQQRLLLALERTGLRLTVDGLPVAYALGTSILVAASLAVCWLAWRRRSVAAVVLACVPPAAVLAARAGKAILGPPPPIRSRSVVDGVNGLPSGHLAVAAALAAVAVLLVEDRWRVRTVLLGAVGLSGVGVIGSLAGWHRVLDYPAGVATGLAVAASAVAGLAAAGLVRRRPPPEPLPTWWRPTVVASLAAMAVGGLGALALAGPETAGRFGQDAAPAAVWVAALVGLGLGPPALHLWWCVVADVGPVGRRPAASLRPDGAGPASGLVALVLSVVLAGGVVTGAPATVGAQPVGNQPIGDQPVGSGPVSVTSATRVVPPPGTTTLTLGNAPRTEVYATLEAGASLTLTWTTTDRAVVASVAVPDLPPERDLADGDLPQVTAVASDGRPLVVDPGADVEPDVSDPAGRQLRGVATVGDPTGTATGVQLLVVAVEPARVLVTVDGPPARATDDGEGVDRQAQVDAWWATSATSPGSTTTTSLLDLDELTRQARVEGTGLVALPLALAPVLLLGVIAWTVHRSRRRQVPGPGDPPVS